MKGREIVPKANSDTVSCILVCCLHLFSGLLKGLWISKSRLAPPGARALFFLRRMEPEFESIIFCEPRQRIARHHDVALLQGTPLACYPPPCRNPGFLFLSEMNAIPSGVSHHSDPDGVIPSLNGHFLQHVAAGDMFQAVFICNRIRSGGLCRRKAFPR